VGLMVPTEEFDGLRRVVLQARLELRRAAVNLDQASLAEQVEKKLAVWCKKLCREVEVPKREQAEVIKRLQDEFKPRTEQAIRYLRRSLTVDVVAHHLPVFRDNEKTRMQLNVEMMAAFFDLLKRVALASPKQAKVRARHQEEIGRLLCVVEGSRARELYERLEHAGTEGDRRKVGRMARSEHGRRLSWLVLSPSVLRQRLDGEHA